MDKSTTDIKMDVKPNPSTETCSNADTTDGKEPKEIFTEVKLTKLSGYDVSKRRESNTSVKSRKSSMSASSRRGSRIDTDDDEFDENGLPHIPNITYRKGSIISFPITDDLPCMRNKRHSISSVSSTRTDASEDVPPIAYRKSSLSVVYTIPDLLLKEDPNENEEYVNGKDELQKANDASGDSKELKFKFLDFNQLLTQIGDFGKFQVYMLLCLIPYLVSYSFIHSSQKYLTLLPEKYWCNVPELFTLSEELKRNLCIPQNSVGMFDRCQEYIPANNSWPLEKDLLVPDPSWNVTSCRNGWHYEMEDIPYASLAVEDNWVCDRSSNLAITRSIFFLGSLLGGFILSWVADRYGRITAVLGSHVVSFLGVALTPFSKDVVLFSLSRFLTGVGHFNAFIFYYIIVLECVGPKWRTFAMTFPFLIFYTVSEVALPWIAYYLADWQWISVITIFPLIVGLIVAIFTPESARWQMATGKVDKAVVTLNKIEKINRSHVDPKLYVQLKESYYRQHPPQRGDSSFKLVFHILKTENLRRNVFGCAVVWASLWFVYHGLMRNPRYFGFGPFTTASLLALTMFPACLLIILTSDVFGRKWLTIASLFFSALTLLLSTIDPGLLSSILAVIGRFLMNFGHIITLQYSAEIIPTVVRGQGLNLIHVLGCIASIVANFVVQMDPQESLLPAIIPGVIGVFGALVCILLPETLGKPLPETLEEGGNMKEDNLFDVICCDTQDDYD